MRYLNTYIEIKNRLSECGLKATHQRIVIYECLAKSFNHPTAENIYESIKPNNPSISLATVYKTLDTFVSAHLIHKVFSDDGIVRYDAYTHPHSHIYCINTKEIIDFEDENLNRLIQGYLKRKKIKNLKIKDIQLQILAEKVNIKEKVSIK
ncbi:MAG: transcriptional repressor [Cytophagaceae bacterium]|nr:transcriptional repressor [Cytophagaceae bacterium]MDW8455360.1 Fur family transcriptional regulator [Cytophagaceae bacterium]